MSFPRYPKYKASGVEWLGEVPENWAVVRLKNVLQQRITDGPHITPVFVDGGVPFLSVDGIQNGELQFEGCRFVAEADHAEFRKKALPKRNDLLMGKAASTGKLARVKVDFEFSIWSPLALIRVNSDIASPTFVEQSLKSPIAQSQIDNFCTANTQKNISMDDIPKLVLTCPPVKEQSLIASFLDRETSKIDELVAEQRRLIELLKEKRQAIISYAVTKGLNSHALMKHSGIEWLGEVPDHWEIRRVKSVSSFVTSGPRGWSERIGDEGSLFVQSGDLNDFLEVDFATTKRVHVKSDAETVRTRLCDGDVVVCVTGAKTGNVAVCTAIPEAAYVNQHLCLIRPTTAIRPLYLGLLLKSKLGQTYFEVSQYGLKQGLSLEDVKGSPALLPPIEEQDEIVTFLHAETVKFDELTAEAECGIEILQERRTALISAAVTGKIDVRSFSVADRM